MSVVSVSLVQIQQMIQKGVAEHNAQLLVQAEHMLCQILNKEPTHWVALFFISNIFLHRGHEGLSSNLLERITTMHPDSSEVWNNLGTSYRRLNMVPQAQYAFEQAYERNKEDADILNNLSTMHINEGSPEKAEEYCLRGLATNPSHKQCHWNLALAYLEQEKFAEGFREYAWGHVTKDRLVKSYGHARWWDGRAHPGKKLVVYGEQGIGDEIMLCSLIPDVCERFEGEVILDCHPRLLGLFHRAFPQLSGIYPTRKIISEEVPWTNEVAPIRYKASLGNIPRFFRHREADFTKIPYLRAREDLVEEATEIITRLGPPPYHGFSWLGGHKKTRKDLRSITLEQWLPVLEANRSGTWISLQYTDHGRSDLGAFTKEHGIPIYHLPEWTEAAYWERWWVYDQEGNVVHKARSKDEAKAVIMHLGHKEHHYTHFPGPAYDYDETAAMVEAIHRLGGAVVSVNTSLVHLCGAMGRRCYVATPFKCAWRYGRNRTDMIWYPKNSVIQFRQPEDGDWSGVMQDIRDAVLLHIKESQCPKQKIA